MTDAGVRPATAGASSPEPRYDDLPLQPSSRIPHSWDVFGADAEAGTVSRLRDTAVLAALASARTGQRVSLTLPVTEPDPPLFRRAPVRHSIRKGDYGWDDTLDNFNPQSSSQWDGLRHIHGRSDGFYGGWDGDTDAEPLRLGVQTWAERGIVGRGVLADITRLPGWAGRDPLDGDAVSPGDVLAALAAGGVEPRHGDILCVRTGWTDRYLELSAAQRQEMARTFETQFVPWRGLAGDEDMARFLWDSGFSAVAVDNPGVEVSPGDPWFGTLHRRLIPGLGFAIGELFAFGALASACTAAGRSEFLFVSVPLNVRGGVGSPANAVAIL
jgi:kynurenine formamidase